MLTNEMLIEYANGTASPGLSLLVAAHLTHSSRAREIVAGVEATCGALLSHEEPVEMAEDSLDATLAELDAFDEVNGHARANGSSARMDRANIDADAGPLPKPLAEALGCGFDEISWRFRLPGVSEYDIPGFSSEKVSLLRVRPGAGIPQHTHEGRELTLILSGAMQDGEAVYRAGDVAVNAEGDDHRPQIIGDEVCVCLVVLEGGLRFTGRFSRALNFLAE